MTRNFHRWEVDPFFQAAEEVQDSADRLESVYRTWLHAKSVDACAANDSIALENHRRELSTALGTAKWQLEDFERAVSYFDVDEQHGATADDAPARHKQFVDALQSQISLVETSLLSSGDTRDLKVLPTIQLCQGEKDDLALFLCGSKAGPQEDLKGAGYCASSTFSNGKGDDETVCTSSESVKSKNEVSDCFSTSASNSEMALSRADFQKSGYYCRPHELGWTDRNIKDCLNLEVHADQSKKYFSSPAYKQLNVDEGRFSVVSESLQHKVYGGHNFLKNSAVSRDRTKRKKEPKNNLTSWLPFTKKLSAFDLRFSRSGLKRWKDGDANSSNHSVWLGHGSSDLERGEDSSFGESLSSLALDDNVSGSGTFLTHRNKASSILQHLIFAFSTNPPKHRVLAVLAALGFVGLILFRVL